MNSAHRMPSSPQPTETSPSLLTSVVASVLLATTLGLASCNKGDPKSDTAADAPSKETVSAPADTTEPVPDTVVADASGSPGVPVRYNVESWNKEKVEKVGIDEVEKLQAKLGKVVTTDKNSLDYASNPATKYRFMQDDAAYLDLVDSPKYLELGWYYANPKDTDAEKTTSTAHAKKAYTFARQLLGEDGGKLVADMLGGQIIKNKDVGNHRVELAKCEFYSCMLIVAKPSA